MSPDRRRGTRRRDGGQSVRRDGEQRIRRSHVHRKRSNFRIPRRDFLSFIPKRGRGRKDFFFFSGGCVDFGRHEPRHRFGFSFLFAGFGSSSDQLRAGIDFVLVFDTAKTKKQKTNLFPDPNIFEGRIESDVT